MQLRKLQKKDAPLMLEWMHDADVVADLKANFAAKTLADCENFVAAAQDSSQDIHFAIADEQDTYMGTVSLKHCHKTWAEFAIVVRKAAMGRGLSRDAMAELLRYGVEKLGLSQIYWCVSRENTRAVRFYDKNGYRRISQIPQELQDDYLEEGERLFWYSYPG